ncbi:MAG: hypothetical protein ACKPKO_53470 [Candidatus Fonsibacter sp.]
MRLIRKQRVLNGKTGPVTVILYDASYYTKSQTYTKSETKHNQIKISSNLTLSTHIYYL